MTVPYPLLYAMSQTHTVLSVNVNICACRELSDALTQPVSNINVVLSKYFLTNPIDTFSVVDIL